MGETVKDPEFQTMTAIGKVSMTDNATAIRLGLLGFSATKLWNTALWYAKEVWEATGKIPSYAEMDAAIKVEHPLW
jgi:putative transposase